jgi:phosphatidylinositol glycan class N
MKSLVTFAIALHLLFLLSIFYIYFRTIIVQHLQPLRPLNDPPAKRLVLLISDGLRAESFFDDNCSRTPFLKSILLDRGLIGVSHTHVPTESRPGHVALIAGVYEDPSSIFRGWKENPVDFDSVFNRSAVTYAWGSPDIVPMFSKGATAGRVITDTYGSDEEVFGTNAPTHLLDKWVFDRVKVFLAAKGDEVRSQTGVVMFLHLLGMDTSGHVHKPHSERFSENLRYVDRGIREIVALIEATFDDDATAFIFTSDHGMTNRGSHGSGHHHETETPFLAWGAGVNSWKTAQDDFVTKTHVTVDGRKIPRYDIQQADAAPLMATLIGTPVPTNSMGKLPYMYPNVTKIYLANAFSNNAYQLHAMYQKLHEQALLKTFRFSFNTRESRLEEEINFLDEQVKLSFTIMDYDDVVSLGLIFYGFLGHFLKDFWGCFFEGI